MRNLFQCFSNSSDKNKDQSRFVPIIIALVTAFSGISFGLANLPMSWDWLSFTEDLSEKYFIDEKSRIEIVNLKGDWRFAIGDGNERSLENFDDSAWSKITVPSHWEKAGFKDYNGYAWYRRQFEFSAENPSLPLYLMLGKIDDVDEVFINGQRVGGLGKFPPDFSTAWNRERVYRLPQGTVRQGKNLISVRVYDITMGGGMYGDSVGIYTAELPQSLVDLAGRWQFRIGDNPDWKNEKINETEFNNIQVPMEWDAQGYKNYNGIAWYRKTFLKPNIAAKTTLVLILGKVDDADEVFLNGVRIGKTGKLDSGDAENKDSYKVKRHYEFSAELLKNNNTIAIRVYDGQDWGGIYPGPVGIMTKAAYSSYLQKKENLNKWRLQDGIDWLMGRD